MKPAEFPLLAWPARLHEDHFMLLDERRLPEREVYVRIEDFAGAASAIANMTTRAFGQLLTVLYAMTLTARKAHGLVEDLKSAAGALEIARPTFGLRKYTQMVVAWAEEAVAGGEKDPAGAVDGKIQGLLDGIKGKRLNRARVAAGLFQDGDVVLTHCNTSGELLLAAREGRSRGKRLKFFATETRPYFQGRLTAWEMSNEGFDVTLVPDNRAASIICDGRCSKVVTGSDRVARNGDIVNKTGTRQLALCAKAAGIPFLAYVQDPGDAETGGDIPIEYRSGEEVAVFRGTELYPGSLDVYYPAFDVTPAGLIDTLITFEGALTPAQFAGMAV
jgi:methylthioribose-1-phosphate isomerase